MIPNEPHSNVLRDAAAALAVIAIAAYGLWLLFAAPYQQVDLHVTFIAAVGTGLALIQVAKALRRFLTVNAPSAPAARAPRPQYAAQPEPLRPAPPEMPVTPTLGAEYGWTLWFERCVSAAQGSRVRAPEAFSHYEAWAATNGIAETVPLQTFGRLMTDRIGAIGGKVLQSNGRVYEGISLADLGDRAVPLVAEHT